MANQPDPRKVQRGLRIDRVLDKKVLKRFRFGDKMAISDAYTLGLIYATENVELSAEEYEQVAEEIKEARKK